MIFQNCRLIDLQNESMQEMDILDMNILDETETDTGIVAEDNAVDEDVVDSEDGGRGGEVSGWSRFEIKRLCNCCSFKCFYIFYRSSQRLIKTLIYPPHQCIW